MGKLTEVDKSIRPGKLTERTNIPFVLSFKYELEKNYKLTDMQKTEIKTFQNFLDRVAGMTFQQVDSAYKRRSDREDTFNNQQVIHYGYSDGARIHGIIENSRFKVIRIDPKHKVHKRK